MTDLIKNYANWVLQRYCSYISVPKETNDLSKSQKVWLILACLSTLAAWTMVLMLPFFLWVNSDIPLQIIYFVIFWVAVGLILPLIFYWLIEALYSLIIWIGN